MKVDKTNYFQIFGLILSIFGIGYIISNGEFERITSLNFNVGDLWMLVCVLTWSLFSTMLKKYKFKFSQFTLLHLMVSVGKLSIRSLVIGVLSLMRNKASKSSNSTIFL